MRTRDPSGVIAALQLYSDKTLVNQKGLSCHPIKATLLNVRHNKRIQDLANVGYFATLSDKPIGLPDSAWRQVKLLYTARALHTLLRPLKAMSKLGTRMGDPWGRLQNVHPRLLSYVADDPESKDVLCIKGGNSEFICEACWVPRSDLIRIDSQWSSRSEGEQRNLFSIQNGLCEVSSHPHLEDKVGSTHVVPCGLWGFCDQQEGVANTMNAFAFESMHNEELGVTLNIIDSIKPFLDARERIPRANQKTTTNILNLLNERMKRIPRAGTF